MFRKSDLKNGDVIRLRTGSVGIVILDINVIIYPDGFDSLDDYDDDLTDVTDALDSSFDIVEVRRPADEYECQFCAFKETLGKVVYRRTNPEDETIGSRYEELRKSVLDVIKWLDANIRGNSNDEI